MSAVYIELVIGDSVLRHIGLLEEFQEWRQPHIPMSYRIELEIARRLRRLITTSPGYCGLTTHAEFDRMVRFVERLDEKIAAAASRG